MPGITKEKILEEGSKSEIKHWMFHPHVNKEEILRELSDTLDTRWIGQGPKVDRFEDLFGQIFDAPWSVAVNSCTSALHLAYRMVGIRSGDRVISPVLSCTATNHPLLQQGAEILFADVERQTLNVDPIHVRELCEEYPETVAIVGVHLGGLPCDITALLAIGEEYSIPVIFDAAQALGAKYGGEDVAAPYNSGYATCFSFQAIKHITTGDGGMLCLEGRSSYERAKKLRWFGIDRDEKRSQDWQAWRGRGITTDQYEVGYKYQMNDVAACFGIVGLSEYATIRHWRRQLVKEYHRQLVDVPGIKLPLMELPGTESSCSLFHVFVDRREDFCKALLDRGVESNMVQIRNDVFTVFGGKRQDLPNMNGIEDSYIYLPLHTRMHQTDVEAICLKIKEGW